VYPLRATREIRGLQPPVILSGTVPSAMKNEKVIGAESFGNVFDHILKM